VTTAPDRRVVAFLATALCLLLWGTYRLARSPRIQLFGTLVPRVETNARVVALTFDDGPAPGVLDEIVDMLQALDVKATFFVTGKELAPAPEAGRRLVEAGHELGNHSYSHRRMVLKTPGFVRSEIERTDELIRRAGHEGEILFRPPYGKKLLVLPWYLRKTGRTSVTWDVDADSATHPGLSAEHLAGRAAEQVRPGSIALFHVWYASRARSRAAVPLFVDAVRDRGYRFVTLSDLLSRRSGGARDET
jgi:peptidoglycan/xylan/chitin deacetylase (PgdA/CDA1 family)